eukprot:g10406.t1
MSFSGERGNGGTGGGTGSGGDAGLEGDNRISGTKAAVRGSTPLGNNGVDEGTAPPAAGSGSFGVGATAPVFGAFGRGGGSRRDRGEAGVTATGEALGDANQATGGGGNVSGQSGSAPPQRSIGGESDAASAGSSSRSDGGDVDSSPWYGGLDKNESGLGGGSGTIGDKPKEQGEVGGGGGGGGGAAAGDDDSDEEPECRVCRGGDEGGARPLAHPCRCRGSIKYVHQDCLVEWLRSRGGGSGGGRDGAAGADDASALQAQRCELCHEKLVFRAKYRPGAPAHLGFCQFVRGAMRRAMPRILDAFRGALNMQLWGLGVPILYCLLFRISLGLGLLFAREFAGFFGSRILAGDPGLLGGGASGGSGLPGLERIGWSGWMDLVGDWCGGVGLMIGVLCLGPPCVELAIEFITVVKALPILLERWWLGDEDPREAPRAPVRRPDDVPAPDPPRGPRPHLGNHPLEVGGPLNEAAANLLVDLLGNQVRNEIEGADNDNNNNADAIGRGGAGVADDGRRDIGAAVNGSNGGDDGGGGGDNDSDSGEVDGARPFNGETTDGAASNGDEAMAGRGEGAGGGAAHAEEVGREEVNRNAAIVDGGEGASGGDVGGGTVSIDANGADTAIIISSSSSSSSSNPEHDASVAADVQAEAKVETAQDFDNGDGLDRGPLNAAPAMAAGLGDSGPAAASAVPAGSGDIGPGPAVADPTAVGRGGNGDLPGAAAAVGLPGNVAVEGANATHLPAIRNPAAAAAPPPPPPRPAGDADADADAGRPPAGFDDMPGDRIVAPLPRHGMGGMVGGEIAAPFAGARAGLGGGAGGEAGAGVGRGFPGEGGGVRGGVLGVLDRVEWFLAGVLEQLAAPPREEEVDGEGLFPWGWPAVGAAGSFLALMGLLLLLAQTIPYAAYHAVNGAVGRGPAANHYRDGHHRAHQYWRHPFWSPSSFLFRVTGPPLSAAAGAGAASPPATSESLFSLTRRRVSPDWSVVFRPSPAAESALLADEAVTRGGIAARRKLSILASGGVGGGRAPASATAAARSLAAFAAAAPEDGVFGWYSIDQQLAASPAGGTTTTTTAYASSSSHPRAGATTTATPSTPGRRAVPGRLATIPQKSSRNGSRNGSRAGYSTGSGSKSDSRRASSAGAAGSSSRADDKRRRGGRKSADSSAAAAAGKLGWSGGGGGGGGKRADGVEATKGGGEGGDDDEWYAMTLALLRGPVIPGTTGLRAGAVLWDTVQGYCLLGFALLLVVMIYSVVRLRWMALARQLEAAIGVDDDVGVATADGVAAARPREGGDNHYQPGGAVPAAAAAAAGRGRDGFFPGVGPRIGGGPAGGGRLWMRGLGGGGGGAAGEVAGGGRMRERDGQIGLDLKVFTMGLLELVILPVWVGIAADLFSLPLLGSTLEARVSWAAGNPFSSLALHWGAGSMAVGVVSCLGKEIGRALRPNLLPQWANRPAEQGLEEVLVRMTHDPFLLQLASFLVSAVTYPAALALMVMVPMQCRSVLSPVWRYMGWAGLSPVVLGIGEPTQGDRLGMDLVIVHFILPVVMEHLKIRGPVRKASCWVLMGVCGATGTRRLLLHPALVAGLGAAANDPDDLDDIALPQPPPPPPPPPRAPPAIVPAPAAVEPDALQDGREAAVAGGQEEGVRGDGNLGDAPNAVGDVPNAVGDVPNATGDVPNAVGAGGDLAGGRGEEKEEERAGEDANNGAAPNSNGACGGERVVQAPVDDGRNNRHLDGQGDDGGEDDEAAGAAGVGGVNADVLIREEQAVEEAGGGAGVAAAAATRVGGVDADVLVREEQAVEVAGGGAAVAAAAAARVEGVDADVLVREEQAVEVAGDGAAVAAAAAARVEGVNADVLIREEQAVEEAGGGAAVAAAAAARVEGVGADVLVREEQAVEEAGDGAAVAAAPEQRAAGEEGVDAGVLAGEWEVDGGDGGAGAGAAEENGVDVGADEDNVGGVGEEAGRGRGSALHLAEAARVCAAGSLVCLALAMLPAVVVLLPLLTGRVLFETVGLPLDDDLPPLVAGGLVCSALAWALSALSRLQVAAGEHGRLVYNALMLAGKWLVIGALLMGALPGLTGLLVHDALRGPLPPSEETAVMTWGKIWALGLVCVKLWARCVLAGAVRDETWRGRLRRVRANGFRGVDFKFTLMEVCFPLLDRVGQFYFWPHLANRFILPLLIDNQRDLRVVQKGTPFVFFLLKAFWAAATFGARKIKALHDLIRDDEYLVGLELENMPPQGHADDAGGDAPSE